MTKWIRRTLAATAALAAMAAAPAWGQAFPGRIERRPAPAPAPTQAQTPQQQQAATAADPAVQQKLAQVYDTASNAVAVAKIGQQRAASPAVKDLARKVEADWQPLVQQAQQLATERGIPISSPSPAAKSALDASTQQLNALSGAAFDQAFVDGERQHFQNVEQQLKDLREATPGQDARLKKWLDDAENVAEKTLADARNATTQFRQGTGSGGK